MKKRTAAILLTVCMIVALVVPVAAKNVDDFTDVEKDAWYYEAVKFNAENDYFIGTSSTTFSPESKMTRAMFVTVLSRVDRDIVKVDDTKETVFPDVETGKYYTGAVAWANEAGIVNGYPDGTYKPDNAITRREMATMMTRYIAWHEKQKNVTHKTVSDPATFSDVDSSDYAIADITKCAQYGIIIGYPDGTYKPGKDATRAEVAQVIERLAYVVKPEENPTYYSYKLKYDGNSLVGAVTNLPAEQSSPLTTATSWTFTISAQVPVLDGYTFTGWTEKADGTGKIYEADKSYTFTAAETTIYAQWTKNETFTVRYLNDDGTILETHADLAKDSATPAFTGGTPTSSKAQEGYLYEFEKWTDSEGNEPAATVTKSVDYTANYKEYKDLLWFASKDSANTLAQDIASGIEKAKGLNVEDISAGDFGDAAFELETPVYPNDCKGDREIVFKASAEIADGADTLILKEAMRVAAELYRSNTTREDIKADVKSVMNQLEQEFGFTFTENTATALINELEQQVKAKAKDEAKSIWAPFHEAEKHYTADVTVTANDGEFTDTVKVDDTNDVSYDGSKWGAVKELAIAVARDFYQELKGYSDWTNVVELKATIKFEFSKPEDADFAENTEKFAYVYNVVFNVKLDGADNVHYKYDNGSKLAITVTTERAPKDAYEETIREKLQSATVTDIISGQIEGRIDSIAESIIKGMQGKFNGLKKAMVEVEYAGDMDEANEKIDEAVSKWILDNMGIKFADGKADKSTVKNVMHSRLFNAVASKTDEIDWTLLEHSAVYDLINDGSGSSFADYVSDYVEEKINDKLPDGLDANDIASLSGETLVDVVSNKGVDLGSLTGAFDPEKESDMAYLEYILTYAAAKINTNREENEGDLEWTQSEYEKQIAKDITASIADQEIGGFNAAKLHSALIYENVRAKHIAALKGALKKDSIKDIILDKAPTSKIMNNLKKLQKFINKLPDDYSITIEDVTYSTNDLKAISKAGTAENLYNAFVELLPGKDTALGKMSLNDVAEKGVKITLKGNGGKTFSFHLYVELCQVGTVDAYLAGK